MGRQEEMFFVIVIQIKLCFWWLHCEDFSLIYVKGTSNTETGTTDFKCTSSEGNSKLSSAFASLFIDDKVV